MQVAARAGALPEAVERRPALAVQPGPEEIRVSPVARGEPFPAAVVERLLAAVEARLAEEAIRHHDAGFRMMQSSMEPTPVKARVDAPAKTVLAGAIPLLHFSYCLSRGCSAAG